MANVVLVGYVIVAMKEDQSEAIEAAAKESKKELWLGRSGQGPEVWLWKAMEKAWDSKKEAQRIQLIGHARIMMFMTSQLIGWSWMGSSEGRINALKFQENRLNEG